MSKIKLDLDSLSVESFSTASQPAERGTVRARVYDTYYRVCLETLDLDSCYGSCDLSCDGSCDASCGGSCLVTECTCQTGCGTCQTDCGTCVTCGTCDTFCGTCDPCGACCSCCCC